MMQLARELKTLARDLSVAVLVRKWAWPAMLAFSLVPGLHQVGRFFPGALYFLKTAASEPPE